MTLILIILDFVLPFFYMVKKTYVKKSIRINHVTLFTIGYLYYWLFPVFIGELFPELGIITWLNVYRAVNENNIQQYLFIILCIYLCFVLGDSFKVKVRYRNRELSYSKKLYIAWIIVSTLYFIYLTYANKSSLFKGYRSGAQDTSYVGTMSALLLTNFSFYSLYSIKNASGRFKQDFYNIYVVPYLFASIIVLGLGGRLYFVTTLLACVVMYNSYYKGVVIGKIVRNVLLGLLAIGTIGLWRIGNSITVEGIVSILFSESLFTSFSLFSYIGTYRIPLLGNPLYLLSSVLFVVPSFLWPDKKQYIFTFDKLGYSIYSPFGAQNSFVSFSINFGIIGTLAFVFFMGYLLKKLKNKDDSLSLVIYSCISAHLTFTFFRDPFHISLIKNIFEFSLAIPWLVATLNTIISNRGRIKRKLEK